MSVDHFVFRAALQKCQDNFGHRLKFRDRRLFDSFIDDESMVALAYEHFKTQIAIAEVDPPDPPPGPTPTPRPTPILDKLAVMLKWVIENQDIVLSFWKGAIQVVAMVVAMFTGI